ANDADPCLTTCRQARCGDGIVCLDLTCTSGPNGGAEVCDDGNTVSGDGCNSSCGPEFCGDGIVQPGLGEECDDGAGNNSNTEPDACRTNCKNPSCGDGVVDSGHGEECDDGNTAAGDGCDATCQREKCGNGVVDVDEGEQCDDGNDVDTDACRNDCTLARCGDGVVCSDPSCTSGPGGGAEQCDDGGESAACDADCSLAQCGDGTVNTTAGEECDDSGESATCDADCTLAACGDGTLNTTAGEVCDTGGESATCDDDCTPVACGDGNANQAAGEECDDGGESATCDADCTLAQCGDGTVNTTAGEQCDDGGESATCDDDCTPVACGDGNANQAAGEECDDGGESATCDADCTLAVCGDGLINETAGEECDDGNTISGDGCSAACRCGPGSGEVGCQDPQCPAKGELTLLAGVGPVCTSNADCIAGTCDPDLGRCVTATDLDTGYTGLGHNADVNHGVVTVSRLLCEGQDPPVEGQPCGVCEVLGLDPGPGNCRCLGGQDCTTNADCPVGWCDTSQRRPICKGANRFVCDEPFQPDEDDCGGAMCACYFGPPLPLSAGNTPACVVNRFARDITGTANVDTGEGEVEAHLRSVVFLGISNLSPCPYCTGDTVLGDGIRDGTCVFGENEGEPCDASAINTTFPAPGGDGYSLDCFPSAGLNISGQGLKIDLVQSTGRQEIPFGIECEISPLPFIPPKKCPCGVCVPDHNVPCHSNAECAGLSFCKPPNSCTLAPERTCLTNADCQNLGPCKRKKCQGEPSVSCNSDADCLDLGPCPPRTCLGDSSITCTTNADCAPADRCERIDNRVPKRDGCETGVCVPAEDGQGVCDPPRYVKECDGIVRANGMGIIGCLSDADCTATDPRAGTCSLLRPTRCFLDPLAAEGKPDPVNPVGAAVFCIAPTSNPGINTAAGLPGPGRVINQARARTFCASDPSVQYQPGIGGCP
ncbi:MAG: hypothetical protein D6815_04325, partial [Candidatus Dadabacteria bacterium]